MAKINQKLTVLTQALTTLAESIALFDEYSDLFDTSPRKKISKRDRAKALSRLLMITNNKNNLYAIHTLFE